MIPSRSTRGEFVRVQAAGIIRLYASSTREPYGTFGPFRTSGWSLTDLESPLRKRGIDDLCIVSNEAVRKPHTRQARRDVESWGRKQVAEAHFT